MAPEAPRPDKPVGMRLGDILGADATPEQELAKINEILREAGFAYPLGWRGVKDMANQLIGLREDHAGPWL